MKIRAFASQPNRPLVRPIPPIQAPANSERDRFNRRQRAPHSNGPGDRSGWCVGFGDYCFAELSSPLKWYAHSASQQVQRCNVVRFWSEWIVWRMCCEHCAEPETHTHTQTCGRQWMGVRGGGGVGGPMACSVLNWIRKFCNWIVTWPRKSLHYIAPEAAQ